jgi:hypothetical protein
MLNFRIFLIIVAASAFSVVACTSAKKSPNIPGQPSPPPPPPPPKFMTKLVTEKPGQDPRCGCGLSRATSLVSTDKDHSRYVKMRTSLYNIDLPEGSPPYDTFDKDYVLEPTGAQFMGCSIQSMNSVPQCKTRAEWSIIDETVVWNVAEFGEKERTQFQGYGTLILNDMKSCDVICAADSADVRCLRLGHDAAPLLSPFIPLLKAANEKPGTVISKADSLKAYGLDASSDQCRRGDILVGQDKIENVGPTDDKELKDGCRVDFNSYSENKIPNNMATHLDSRVSYLKSKVPFTSLSGSGTLLTAEDANNSTTFQFLQKDASQEEEERAKRLNLLYGGLVRKILALGDTVIIATSNGCVRASYKQQ